MRRKLKLLGILTTVVAGCFSASSTFAQSYPNRPIRVVIGYGPGGITDVAFRVASEEARKPLGQPVVVENRPGANGLVAAQAVKGSPPDGYTLFGGTTSALNAIFVKESLDGLKELTPVVGVVYGDWFLCVGASTGSSNLKEFLAYAKSKGTVRLALPNTINGLIYSGLAKRMGFKFETIPYKSTEQIVSALAAGDIDGTIAAYAGYEPMIQAGKIKAIATLSPQRSPARPYAATAKEQGVNMELTTPTNSVWGPPKLPNDIVARLASAYGEALKSPALGEKFRSAGMLPSPLTSPDLVVKDFQRELAFFSEAIALSGYQPQ